MNINEAKLAEAMSKPWGHGSHDNIDDGMCVMEAVSYVAGEEWSDNPACACPIVSDFMRTWNDSLCDADRNKLLKPLIPRLVGSRSTTDVATKRSYLALDWLVRVFTPEWLDLVPSLREHAKTLRGLDTISDEESAESAHARLEAAGSAAWAAAGVLDPVVSRLQLSALDLVNKMLDITDEEQT